MSETLFVKMEQTTKFKCKTKRDHRGWERHLVLDESGTIVVRTAPYRAGSEASQEAFLWLWRACQLHNAEHREQ